MLHCNSTKSNVVCLRICSVHLGSPPEENPYSHVLDVPTHVFITAWNRNVGSQESLCLGANVR